MYREGTEGTIDGQVDGDMYDMIKETKGGKLAIKYPFSPYKCTACWEIMESPKKLVQHMGAKHKDDFIEFSCAICNKSDSRAEPFTMAYVLKALLGEEVGLELVSAESQCL